MKWGGKKSNSICLHKPDEIDIELRTFVIAIEFISQSGDHIVKFCYLFEVAVFPM